jgi:hypothetical protein
MNQQHWNKFSLDYAKSKTIKNWGNKSMDQLLHNLLQSKTSLIQKNPFIKNELLKVFRDLENNWGTVQCNEVQYIIDNISDPAIKQDILKMRKFVESNFAITNKIKQLKIKKIPSDLRKLCKINSSILNQ